MSPIELFHEARLTEAIAAQKWVVAASPNDIGERLLLCDLLAMNGERDQVRQQLDTIFDVPAEVREYIAEWRTLLKGDNSRQNGCLPEFLVNGSTHLAPRIAILTSLIAGDEEHAILELDEAEEMAPWIEGHIDGRGFDGWRDVDDLLGPTLEVLHGNNYCWVDMNQIRKLRLEDGEELRDILYKPATLWLVDGSKHEVFIPGLYVGSAKHEDEGIRTGAGIDYVEEHGITRALGGRTFLFGEEELTLAEFRQVEVRPG
ncbi:MAG TPA: type VI secretion system accessory protein TagJ [Gemmataceae bacterium]|jgi:type VI secretion system protein ImpE|nr:type VI secretion system accessory protein TagJ [Gemmataceae bacterium]